MRLSTISIMISFTCLSIILVGCSRPIKTYAYFEEHPEEIKIEAKRCLEDDKNGKSSIKDKTCLNAATAESMRCIYQIRTNGTEGIVSCDGYYRMLQLAAEGF